MSRILKIDNPPSLIYKFNYLAHCSQLFLVCPVLSCLVSPYPVLSCLTVSFLILYFCSGLLSHLALSYPIIQINQPINHSIKQAIAQSINSSIHQAINHSIKQFHQSMNQPTDGISEIRLQLTIWQILTT